MIDTALPVPISWSQVDIYFAQHFYHSENDVEDARLYPALDITYYRDHTPYTDMRHWDNLGFEVIPAVPVKPLPPVVVSPPPKIIFTDAQTAEIRRIAREEITKRPV